MNWGADQLGNPTSLLPLAVPKAVSSLKKAKWIRPTQPNIAGPGAPIVGVLNIFEYIFWILILCLMTLCISIIDIYRTIKFFTLTVIIFSWIGHLWHITFLEKSWAIILETSCTICAPNVKISYHPLSLITALKWINYCVMEILWTPKHTFSSQGFLRGGGWKSLVYKKYRLFMTSLSIDSGCFSTNPDCLRTNPGGFGTNSGYFRTNYGCVKSKAGCFRTNPVRFRTNNDCLEKFHAALSTRSGFFNRPGP